MIKIAINLMINNINLS